jgi:hypothetical protein
MASLSECPIVLIVRIISHVFACFIHSRRTYCFIYAYVTCTDFHLEGRALFYALIRRLLIAGTRVLSHVTLCEICGGQSGTGHVFIRVLQFTPDYIIPPMIHIDLHLHVALSTRKKARRLGIIFSENWRI